MAEKEFKLPKNLEQLIGASSRSQQFTRLAQGPMNNNIIDAAKQHYGVLAQAGITQNFDPNQFGGMTPYDFRSAMNVGHSMVQQTLDQNINDITLANAKKFYMGQLDLDRKADFYVEMLKSGADIDRNPKADDTTKKTYQVLDAAKSQVQFAQALESAVMSGDLETAKALAAQQFELRPVEAEYLTLLGHYGGPSFRDSEKGVYLSIARQAYVDAKQIINEAKLSGVIESGMKNKVSKADNLSGLYKAYTNQLAYNEQKKKAEAAAKAA